MFQDEGQTLDDFGDVIYVRCPRCGRRAQVARIVTLEDEQRASSSAFGHYLLLFCARKLSCLRCGHTKIWEGKTLARGGPYDWYFRLPLWLQTPCCGATLWALNRAHLDFLVCYVSALQRTKMRVSVPGKLRNRSMASRLPRWLKSAKNRETVTRSLTRLRDMLEEA